MDKNSQDKFARAMAESGIHAHKARHIPPPATETSLHEGLAKLSDCGSHDFLTPEFAQAITDCFGVVPAATERITANGRDPKGLFTADGITRKVEGVSAYALAVHVADAIGIAHGAGGFLGRGFRFRAALEALTRYVRTFGPPPAPAARPTEAGELRDARR